MFSWWSKWERAGEERNKRKRWGIQTHDPYKPRHMTESETGEERGCGVWNPRFYFRKSKMVGRETPEKFKKSNCSPEKNRNTQVEQIQPYSPFLSSCGRRERTFTWVLIGVCEIKIKRNKEMRGRTHFEAVGRLWRWAYGHHSPAGAWGGLMMSSVSWRRTCEVENWRGICKDEKFLFKAPKARVPCGSYGV